MVVDFITSLIKHIHKKTKCWNGYECFRYSPKQLQDIYEKFITEHRDEL